MSSVVYFDLDDTLCKFHDKFHELKTAENPYPHHERDFYDQVKPIEGGVELFKKLIAEGVNCMIASAPSPMNPETYSGKARWVIDNIGAEYLDRLIIINDKSLLIGSVLIDDRSDSHNQNMFDGELRIVDWFTNWKNLGVVVRRILNRGESVE